VKLVLKAQLEIVARKVKLALRV
jgi:hypothetical protein